MANEQNWATGVNQKILRDGASWGNPVSFIEDETRSGKRKRRLYASQQKKTFSIKMNFTSAEYVIFDDWFLNTLKGGLYSFYFPQIDGVGTKTTKVYRFTKDGVPQYSNPSGKIVSATMKWEEL